MAASVTIKLSGDIARDMARVRSRSQMQLGGAILRTGEAVMTDSKAEYCPVETGALRASGHVTGPVYERDRITVDLGYGGPAAPYAEIVHERLDVHHPVGQAKYLETPAMAAEPKLIAAVKQAMAGVS